MWRPIPLCRSTIIAQALLVCAAIPLYAQQADRGLKVGGPLRRSALVIGIAAYPKAPLDNTLNDGRDVAEALKGFGFDVELLLDANRRSLSEGIDRWVAGLQGTGVALLFYSGHGIQVDGENFLIPADFDAKDEADAKYQGYSLDRIHERMLRSGSPLNILIVDACRNNPFARTRATMGGLAAMSAGKGSFIAFATAPGSVASDNPGQKNGLFTKHLLNVLPVPNLDLSQIFDRVRTEVYRDSGERQLPWTASSVIGTFMFHDLGRDEQRLSAVSDELKRAEAELQKLESQRQLASRSRQEQTAKEAEAAKIQALREGVKAKQFEQERLRESLQRQARIEEERRQNALQEQQESLSRQRRNQEMEARLADVRRQTLGAQRELESVQQDQPTLEQARLQVAKFRTYERDVVARSNTAEQAALRDLERDYEALRAELRAAPGPKDVFETTAQYQARLRQYESRKKSVEAKFQSEQEEIQRRYAMERNSQTAPYAQEVSKLTNRTYLAPTPKWELLNYDADAASLMMGIDGRPYAFRVSPENAKAVYEHADLLRIDLQYTYHEAGAPAVGGLALLHPALGKITTYSEVDVSRLVNNAQNLFEAKDLSRFLQTAEIALKAGGVLTFQLQHHHRGYLQPHWSELAFSRHKVSFEPHVSPKARAERLGQGIRARLEAQTAEIRAGLEPKIADIRARLETQIAEIRARPPARTSAERRAQQTAESRARREAEGEESRVRREAESEESRARREAESEESRVRREAESEESRARREAETVATRSRSAGTRGTGPEARCTYQAFTVPLGSVSSFEVNGEFLTLKILDAKGKIETLNFSEIGHAAAAVAKAYQVASASAKPASTDAPRAP